MSQLLICNCSLCRRQTGAQNVSFGAFTRQDIQLCVDGDAASAPKADRKGAPAGKMKAAAQQTDGQDEFAGKQQTGSLRSLQLSEVARRDFCSGCGAFVLMDYFEKNTVYMSLGLVEDVPGLIKAYLKELAAAEGIEEKDSNVSNDGKHVPEERTRAQQHAYAPTHVFAENATFQCIEALSPPLLPEYGLYVVDSCEETVKRKPLANWKEDPAIEVFLNSS